jgi:hypothetical protein
MSSSGILRRVALVRSDDAEELRASIIRVTRIGEPGTLVVTSNRRTLRRNTILSACKEHREEEMCKAVRVTAWRWRDEP